MLCVNTLSIGSMEGQTTSQIGFSHRLWRKPAPAIGERFFRRVPGPKNSLTRTLNPLQSFVQRNDRVFRVLFPQFQSCFVSPQTLEEACAGQWRSLPPQGSWANKPSSANFQHTSGLYPVPPIGSLWCSSHSSNRVSFLPKIVVFAFWIIKNTLTCPSFSKGLCFLVFIRLVDTGRLTHFFVVLAQFSPSLYLQYLCRSPGRKHANQHTSGYPFSSALRVNSSGPSMINTSGLPSSRFGLQGMMIVHFGLVTILCIGPSPSTCWFANNMSALNKFSRRPCGTTRGLKTLA